MPHQNQFHNCHYFYSEAGPSGRTSGHDAHNARPGSHQSHHEQGRHGHFRFLHRIEENGSTVLEGDGGHLRVLSGTQTRGEVQHAIQLQRDERATYVGRVGHENCRRGQQIPRTGGLHSFFGSVFRIQTD